MIEGSNGEWTMFCDQPGCDGELEYCGDEYSSFSDFIQDAKDDNWRISKQGGEWKHTCPECAKG